MNKTPEQIVAEAKDKNPQRLGTMPVTVADITTLICCTPSSIIGLNCLGNDGRYHHTVHWEGYRFKAESDGILEIR